MRVIILWPGTHNRTLTIVVVLISQIPIESPVDLDRQTSFRRLVAHGIGRDQSPRCSSRISQAVALPVVLVYSIRREKTYPGSNLCHRIDKEEIISGKVQAVTERMPDTVEEIINHGVTVDPVVVVASAD